MNDVNVKKINAEKIATMIEFRISNGFWTEVDNNKFVQVQTQPINKCFVVLLMLELVQQIKRMFTFNIIEPMNEFKRLIKCTRVHKPYTLYVDTLQCEDENSNNNKKCTNKILR